MSSRIARAASDVARCIWRLCTEPHRTRASHDRSSAPCPVSGFPAPESFEPGAMPPKDSLRLHHLGQIKQIGANPRDPYQQRPVTTVQPQTRRPTPQGDVELMTEKQILGFEPASRLEHVGDEHSELVQDHKHRSE